MSDGLGAEAIQNYTLAVVPDSQAPRVTIVVTGESVLYPWTLQPAIVRVIASDDVGLTDVELQVDGQTVELAADGTARVYFSAPGKGRLEAVATDAAGNRGTAVGRVNMRSGEDDGSGNPAPVVAITSVQSGDEVRGIVDLSGTASSPDFAEYTLSYRRMDQADSTTILRRTTPVTDASLGRWDTTLLENDQYVLRLEVADTWGSISAVEVEVSVVGSLKLGNFRLSFADLSIPVAGIPITIVRTYDTLRSDRDGDLGYGWRMEYRDTDLRTSLPKSGLEDLGIFSPFKAGTRVFLTMPGGVREGFTFTPEYRVLPGFGHTNNLVIGFPRFTPDRGVKSNLSAGSGALIANESGELYTSGGIPWNPASPEFGGYTLAAADGTSYRIDGATGRLASVTDRNGNTLTFNDSGVASSAGGVQLRFDRDAQGRVAAIVDPEGNAVRVRILPRRRPRQRHGPGRKCDSIRLSQPACTLPRTRVRPARTGRSSCRVRSGRSLDSIAGRRRSCVEHRLRSRQSADFHHERCRSGVARGVRRVRQCGAHGQSTGAADAVRVQRRSSPGATRRPRATRHGICL